MRPGREIYNHIKNGGKIDGVERRYLLGIFNGDFSSLTYHLILAFGLSSNGEVTNIERMRKIIQHMKSHRDDDLLAAALIVACNYWANPESILAELRSILSDCVFEDFEDAIIVSLRAFARSTFRCRSVEMLEYLKKLAVERLPHSNPLETELYVEAVLLAATGKPTVEKSEILLNLDQKKLSDLSFSMP